MIPGALMAAGRRDMSDEYTRGPKARMWLRETAAKYLAEPPRTVTLSSKYQVTLPVAMVRALDLKPGDRIRVELEGEGMMLRPQPQNLVEYFMGSMKGIYGKNKEEMDGYVRGERESWRHRDRIIGLEDEPVEGEPEDCDGRENGPST